MKYNEIEKNTLYDDYINNDLSVKDMMLKYNYSKKQLFTRLKFYNIKKPEYNPIDKDTLFKLYIIDNNTIEDIMKIQNMDYNSVRYFIKKYNIKKSYDLIQQTREKTNIEKYGVSNTGWLVETQEKIKSTCQEKYGVNSPLASKEIQDKIKKTNIEKYGVDNMMKSDEGRAILVDGIRNKYGVDYACLTDNCISSMKTKDSKPNNSFAELLDQNGISYEREYRINNRSYDFKVGNYLIEINPSATHNSTFGVHGKEPIDHLYHKNKSDLAELNGFQCVHIFDWEDQNKILSIIREKAVIFARKCEIKEVDEIETNIFINAHHIQGTCKNQIIRLGLYYNDELVEIMTFGKPRYSQTTEYELLRLCTCEQYKVVGGASRLFNYFIKTYDPKSIVSYCDNSKFNGNIYKLLGFNKKSNGEATIHWYNMKTKKHYTDNLIRSKGFDNIFKTHHGKGTDNAELMRSVGFIEVYDCGQSTYIWKSK